MDTSTPSISSNGPTSNIQNPPIHSNSTSATADKSKHNSSQPRRGFAANRGRDQKPFHKGQQGRGRGGGQGKKRDLGRAEWAKLKVDKRKRNDDEQEAKRQRIDKGDEPLPVYATKFSDEVLQAEERRPKKKVAVLLGYAGTGYKGMQLAHDQKTIEGDLFQAFVKAGAISKANADDPKKSSFVRCARTDKGVHAAGNVISLKLIVEDEDIVKKINENLGPQIRIWGFERTNNSFSAYQTVDSRIYEYLIPTHSFLPPHPRSYLGRQCEEQARLESDYDNWKERQQEVEGYWETVDEEQIKIILEEYDADVRSILEKALYLREDGEPNGNKSDVPQLEERGDEPSSKLEPPPATEESTTAEGLETTGNVEDPAARSARLARYAAISEGTRRLRQAYIAAKRAYRMPTKRLERIKDLLNMYVGTRNYHNFTVDKTFGDPSAKRVIKSFVVNPTPILINGTEWLSLKVHGQSFMMHQIRKMVAMVTLIVRCGCDPKRLTEALGEESISIPKAPSLGLLLERPIFESYNKRASKEYGKESLDFDKYKTEMDNFKQREIYERMYSDEEKENVFGNFFAHTDSFPEKTFLFVTSGGIEATRGGNEASVAAQRATALAATQSGDNSDDEDELQKVDQFGGEG